MSLDILTIGEALVEVMRTGISTSHSTSPVPSAVLTPAARPSFSLCKPPASD